jgi:nucleoid DNA-binding protein
MKNKNYNKSNIIKRVSSKVNISNDDLKIIFDCFLSEIVEIIKEPADRVHIEIRNFGSFDVYPTKARTNARNPLTKKKVVIPARKKITFKPSKIIKDAIYKERK